MENPILNATRAAVAAAGVPEKEVNPLANLLFDLLDRAEAETPEEAAASEIDADDYYDFLESWDAGHRRFRKWVREKEVGYPVKLTNEGRRVCMHVVETTGWRDAFKSSNAELKGRASEAGEGPR